MLAWATELLCEHEKELGFMELCKLQHTAVLSKYPANNLEEYLESCYKFVSNADISNPIDMAVCSTLLSTDGLSQFLSGSKCIVHKHRIPFDVVRTGTESVIPRDGAFL